MSIFLRGLIVIFLMFCLVSCNATNQVKPEDATESKFKHDLFVDTNLTAHCHNTKLPSHWTLPSNPSYQYQGNKILWVEGKTTREVLEALVPKPLNINEENRIIFFIGRLRISRPNPITYGEGGIVVPVSYKDKNSGKIKQSVFIPILYLDEQDPIIGGRVVYGANKHYAEVKINEDENTVSASISKSDVKLMDMSVTLQNQVIDTVTDQENGGWIAVKCTPSSRFHTLSLANVLNHKIHELHIGEGQLKLGASKLDPLSKIPILEITNAGFQIDSSTLGKSSVVYKYPEH